MLYKCIPCNYSSINKNNLERHEATSKHKNIIKQHELGMLYTCKYCAHLFAKELTFNDHVSSCPQKAVYEAKLEMQNTSLIEKIQYMELQINEKVQSIEKQHIEKVKILEAQLISVEKQSIEKIKSVEKQHNEKVKILEAQLAEKTTYLNTFMQREHKTSDFLMEKTTSSDNRYEKLIENTGTFANNSLQTINNTVSALKFIQTNYSDAPVLKALSNYNCFKKTTSEKFVQELLYYHKNDLLVKYIGDTYVQEYLKDNPAEQAMWNSDNARLSYYIRQPDKEVNYTDWVQDKQGLKIIDITIKPILKFLNDEVANYTAKKVEGGDYKLMEKCANLQQFLNGVPQKYKMNKIPRSLPEEIVKYISPKFLLNKSQPIKPSKPYKRLKSSTVTIKESVEEEQEEQEERLEEEQEEDEEEEDEEEEEEEEEEEQIVENARDPEFICYDDTNMICNHYQDSEVEIYDLKKKTIRLKK
jgi:hypothetical protein